ncbi:MAG: AraC family transcriptional regulator [Blautia marasmi]
MVDISYQYGYDSPTSFTKAFQQFHGMTPKEARNGNVRLRVVPKMQIFEKQRYAWKLEQKPGFRLIGKSVWCADGQKYSKIPEFWSDCQNSGVFSRLISLGTGDPGDCLVCAVMGIALPGDRIFCYGGCGWAFAGGVP